VGLRKKNAACQFCLLKKKRERGRTGRRGKNGSGPERARKRCFTSEKKKGRDSRKKGKGTPISVTLPERRNECQRGGDKGMGGLKIGEKKDSHIGRMA